jgi:DNA repair exonuclease SbcCD nuclease subunit
MKHVRYSGSLDRCDFGEIDQPKAVVLLELGPDGLKSDPVCLPVPSTTLLHLVVDNPDDDLPLLEQQYPDRDNLIVRVHATHVPGGLSREEITRELRRLFPRLYELTWTEKPDPNAAAAPAAINPRGNLRQVIADFLDVQLKEDPDRDELLTLLEPYVVLEEQR